MATDNVGSGGEIRQRCVGKPMYVYRIGKPNQFGIIEVGQPSVNVSVSCEWVCVGSGFWSETLQMGQV